VPGADVNWQESVVIYLWDPEQHCYAFFRIGHEPNYGPGGTAAIWSNIWVPGYYYKYYDAVPLQPGDRFADGFASGTKIRYEYHGKHHWTVQDDEVFAELVMEDWNPAFDFWPAQNNMREIAPHHMEASGKVTGVIKFKDQTYRIGNGIGHRDHSWGLRRWETVLTHRWLPTVFGKDLMSQAVTMLTDQGELIQCGFVIRDGKLYVPTEVSVDCMLEVDGLTNRGGAVTYTLPSGEKLEMVFHNIVPGGLSWHHTFAGFDPMSVVTCGGRSGFGVMETSNNSLNGRVRPKQDILISGYIDNGIFPCRQGSSRIRA
jgi:hypothetical protein